MARGRKAWFVDDEAVQMEFKNGMRKKWRTLLSFTPDSYSRIVFRATAALARELEQGHTQMEATQSIKFFTRKFDDVQRIRIVQYLTKYSKNGELFLHWWNSIVADRRTGERATADGEVLPPPSLAKTECMGIKN